MKISIRRLVLGAAVLTAGVSTPHLSAWAQTAVSLGDLVVLQVADRTVSSGQSVSLLEFTPNASANMLTTVQAFAVPSASGSSNRFVITGNSTAGGILSLNANNTITFAGYRADVGTATLASSSVNRVLGSLNLGTGTVNTNLGLAGSSNTFRGAAVNDAGTTVYLSGANGIQFANTATQPATPNSTAVSTASLIGGNTRQVAAFNGNLFVSSGSTTPGAQVFQVGSGEPTTGSQSTTGLFGGNSATNQYNTFAFVRLGTGAAYNGFDTIYAVNNSSTNASSVLKFTYAGTGSTFNASGSISLAGVNDIALRQNAGSVDLFVTTLSTAVGAGNSTVQSLTDATGFGGDFSAGTFTTLLSSTGNEGFYGLAFVPVPEPATLLGGVLLVAAFGWSQRRRLRAVFPFGRPSVAEPVRRRAAASGPSALTARA